MLKKKKEANNTEMGDEDGTAAKQKMENGK